MTYKDAGRVKTAKKMFSTLVMGSSKRPLDSSSVHGACREHRRTWRPQRYPLGEEFGDS